ncbi:MAG: tetratricopeptide repeat protein [Acidobacteriaceae bacterium]
MSVALHSRAQSRPTFDALAHKAEAARDANRLDEAVGLYQRALALRPSWKEGWWSLGTIQYDRNHYAEAKRALRKVVAQDPESGTARLMLGLSEFELGEDDAALREFELAKKQSLAPDTQMLDVMFFHEGVLLRRARKFEAAAQVLQDLCARNPSDGEIVRELGMVALRIPDKLYPAPTTSTGEAAQRLGEARCRIAQKQFEAAQQIAKDVAAQFPQEPNVHYAYGRVLLDSNDPTAAIGSFEEEIKNQPNDVFSRLEIAAAEYRMDSAAGIPYAEAAVRLDPRVPIGHYLLGLLLVDVGQYETAVPQLEIARETFSDDSRVYFALAKAYTHVGRSDDAAQARKRFLQLSQEQAAHPRTHDYGVGEPSILSFSTPAEATSPDGKPR